MDVRQKNVVVTGGTDGIGAATALELVARGAQVTIIGRSRSKGEALVRKAAQIVGGGKLEYLEADFSLQSQVLATVETLGQRLKSVDLLVHCVGILIAHKEYTAEGIEKDFAVGYLSRFVMTKALVNRGLLKAGAVMINLAASGPKIPKMAKLEFNDLAVVEARHGMVSHGQAQMANDLFSVAASSRWGLSVVGYGPGSVDTGIRRELPQFLVALMSPFFVFSTRKPAAVGLQLAEILKKQTPPAGQTWFFDKNGRFDPDGFVTKTTRVSELWSVSEALAKKALGHHS